MQFFVTILATLCLLTACGEQKQPPKAAAVTLPASAAVPADPDQMARRQEIYQTWKRDLDELAAKANEPLLTKVKEYLDQGVALAAPQANDTFMVRTVTGLPMVTIVVFLPEDVNVSKGWAERYQGYIKHSVGASYNARGNWIFIRPEPLAPLMRGILLGHEGFHALAAHMSLFANQDDEEYCGEEAVAHRLEIEVLKAVAPDFSAHTQQEGKKVAASLKASKGKAYKATLFVDEGLWDKTFGQKASELERGYRGTLLNMGAVYFGALDYYKGDDNQAMGRLAYSLCGIYKKNGIR